MVEAIQSNSARAFFCRSEFILSILPFCKVQFVSGGTSIPDRLVGEGCRQSHASEKEQG